MIYLLVRWISCISDIGDYQKKWTVFFVLIVEGNVIMLTARRDVADWGQSDSVKEGR